MTIYGSLLSRATHTLKNNRGSALEDVKKQSVERMNYLSEIKYILDETYGR